jgi:arylsulfatase A-like enzyme
MDSKRFFGYGMGLVLAMGVFPGLAQKPGGPKPNVLYIIMDDMCDWTHYLGGNNQVKTPNLDRLAARGVSFSNAYTAVPLCNPSRTAMFTGMQPFVTGIYNNKQPISNSPVANNSLMMPQHFRNNGYVTICAGKIFHTKPSSEVMNSMWDDMVSIDGGYGPFVRNSGLPNELQEKWQDFQAWTGPDTDFPDVRNSQKVIEFLGEKRDKPFFAAMGFYRPHSPWTAPERYFDLYDINKIKRPITIPDDLADIPAFAIDQFIGVRQVERQRSLSTTSNYWEQMVRAYLACVSFADDRVGLILDALDKSPYADNTLIVLVGDNGFHHGEKERWGKSALWREACHVPLVIVAPKGDKRIAKGNCTSVVSSIDIYPTLIDACNLPKIENQLAGNSLMPLLSNVNMKWNKPSVSTFLPGNFVIHANQWNFIKYVDGSMELYNTANDENEFVNLARKPEYNAISDSLSLFLPISYVSGIQQTNEDDESLPNKGPLNRKRRAMQNK